MERKSELTEGSLLPDSIVLNCGLLYDEKSHWVIKLITPEQALIVLNRNPQAQRIAIIGRNRWQII